MRRVGVFSAVLLILAGGPAWSAPGADSAAATEHSFDDLLVQGKYHFSDEAVATVEEDKVLDALIGTRTDFKDRLEQSEGQY